MRTGTLKKKCVCFCKKCILEKKDQANSGVLDNQLLSKINLPAKWVYKSCFKNSRLLKKYLWKRKACSEGF